MKGVRADAHRLRHPDSHNIAKDQMNLMRRNFCIALLVCLVGGCTATKKLPNRVKVVGRVTSGGAPLHVERRDIGLGMVTIGFFPIVEDGPLVEATSAQADAEGNFEVIDGLEPGKYLISVRQWDPYPQIDRLQGRFDERNSKIIRDFSGDEAELVIDVSDPES